jgi:hypothetical protein
MIKITPKSELIQDTIIVDGTNWTVGCFSCHDQTLHFIGMEGFEYSVTNDSLHFIEDGGIWPNPYGTTSYTSVGAYATFPTVNGSLVLVFDARARARHLDAVLMGIRIYDPSNMTWLMSSASHPENIPQILRPAIDSGWQQLILNVTVPGLDELAVFWSFNDFFDYDWSQEFWVENILVNPEISEIPEPNYTPIIYGSEDFTYCINCLTNFMYIYPYWLIVDDNPDNYTIYANDVASETGSIVYGEEIYFDMYNKLDLEVGMLNLTILARDLQNNIASDTIFVNITEVTDSEPPSIDAYSNLTIYGIISNITISWIVQDDYPDYYEIYLDFDLVYTGFWESEEPITYNLEISDYGTYIVHLIVFDDWGNSAVNAVIIEVVRDIALTSFPVVIVSLISLVLIANMSIRRKKKKH